MIGSPGRRGVALCATVKAIANADSGDLAKFIGVLSLNSFINKDLILAELIEFPIPGPQLKGLCLTLEPIAKRLRRWRFEAQLRSLQRLADYFVWQEANGRWGWRTCISAWRWLGRRSLS